MRKALITIALSILSIGMARAQVTIGSKETPLEGTLLYLKQTGVTNKGLGLPRVSLTDLRKLTMGNNEIADTLVNNGASTVWKEHAGLVVYNVRPLVFDLTTCKNTGVPTGVHLWTGEEWQGIGGVIEGGVGVGTGSEADVRIVTDPGKGVMQLSYKDEVTTYRYSKFGAAGTWMTENLNTQYAPNGTKLKLSAGPGDVGRGAHNFSYPSSSSPIDDTDYKANYNAVPRKPVGLLYDWYTATNSENCSEKSQVQVGGVAEESATPSEHEVELVEETSPGAKNGKIKGICPIGWHLPSDREWNELLYALHNDPEVYSVDSGYDKEWEDSPGINRSIGGLMKSGMRLENSDPEVNLDYFYSKPAESGGFALLLPGIRQVYSTRYYGVYTYLWSSGHGYSEYIAMSWYLACGGPTVTREFSSIANYFSVRCKKDE